MDDDQAHESGTETVSLGGNTGGGRFGALVGRLSARPQSAIIAGSTMLLGIVMLGTIVLTGNDADAPARRSQPPPSADTTPSPASNAPSPDALLEGERVWIGYHDVMLALPRSWAQTNSARCGTTTTNPATPPRAPHSKCSLHTSRQRSIVLWLRQDVAEADLLDSGFHARSIGGGSALITTIKKTGPNYLQYAALPQADTLVVIRSPDRSTITRLVQSLRPIPATWVAVPNLRGQSPRRALLALASLGLVGRAAHNSGMVMPAETVVVNQNPEAGQIVTPQTPVTIAVLPASVRSNTP